MGHKEDSALRDLMVANMKPCMDRNRQWKRFMPDWNAVCSMKKLSGLDCVSFGPNMKAIHTTEERLFDFSVERRMQVRSKRVRQA